ncbi:MAG: RNA methyltransferase [Gammaproteobacteria bacterium]|nr:RNA methyltransferase [Gammaproteobacteria bacterium]MDH5275644.1 RNA methyltransferase [Gammaproteobacteria bacterium]
MTLITSSDNPRFRELLGLAGSARDRRQAGLALIDGLHLIDSYRQRIGAPELLVVSDSGRHQPAVATLLAATSAVPCLELSDALFRRLSPVQTPTGVLAIIPIPARGPLPEHPEACVLLEDVQDPGNLGSILRSTAAAGIRQVYLSQQCADLWSPKVLRAGMGAHFHLECFAGADLAGFAATFPGQLIATHHHARQSVFEVDLRGNIGLIFGNEGAGLSRALLDVANCVVAIPMPGQTESLNIAAAAAVCLFERVRQLK